MASRQDDAYLPVPLLLDKACAALYFRALERLPGVPPTPRAS